MIAFANSVIERYQNPFIRHELMSIALNSTTKFKTRILPTLVDYVRITGKLPQHVMFSFAALCEFYKGMRGTQPIELKDDPEYLAFWAKTWAENAGNYTALAKAFLSWKAAWDMDMTTIHPDIVSTVAKNLEAIEAKGMRKAVEEFVNG
jgi:tagaturonate reductase